MFTELFIPRPPKITPKVVEEAGQKIQQVELLKGVARDSTDSYSIRYKHPNLCIPYMAGAKFGLRNLLSPSILTVVKIPLDNVLDTLVGVRYQEE